ERDVQIFFDSHLDYVERFTDVYGEERSRRDRERMEQDRQKVLVIWHERKKAYDEWREASGYADLEREEMRLLKEEDRLDDLIMGWQAQNLEEVHIKSQYVLLAYEGAFGPDTAKRFLMSVGGQMAA